METGSPFPENRFSTEGLTSGFVVGSRKPLLSGWVAAKSLMAASALLEASGDGV